MSMNKVDQTEYDLLDALAKAANAYLIVRSRYADPDEKAE
jgi:hypothetical protein